jgi:hypothetical protein
MKYLFIALSFILCLNSKGQQLDILTNLLELDTQYCFLQYHSLEVAQNFRNQMKKSSNDRVVICHYGASHIQSEIVTKKTSSLLKEKFGDAGPGFIFPFSAADTYDGVNYKTSHTGKWNFSKSYQLPPKLPLGIRGMTVQTRDSNASVTMNLKSPLKNNDYDVFIFLERNENTPAFELKIDSVKYIFSSDKVISSDSNYLKITHRGPISKVKLTWMNDSLAKSPNQVLTFYGISIEHQNKIGLMYHPFGVGASPFEAVLNLGKLKKHAQIIKPDIVIIDYGTNNILYTNKVPNNLPEMVEEAVKKFRAINPNISIILTSTQDLFYKKKYISAAIDFNYMMDSLAAVNQCLYWNFYDLSGGYKRIRDWNSKGYARDDFIHLTQKGYDLKGLLLFNSFINTMEKIDEFPELNQWSMPVCRYEDRKSNEVYNTDQKNTKTQVDSKEKPKEYKNKVHIVKNGDTLSEIAAHYGTTVNKLKKLNRLSSDKLKIKQKIKIN